MPGGAEAEGAENLGSLRRLGAASLPRNSSSVPGSQRDRGEFDAGEHVENPASRESSAVRAVRMLDAPQQHISHIPQQYVRLHPTAFLVEYGAQP